MTAEQLPVETATSLAIAGVPPPDHAALLAGISLQNGSAAPQNLTLSTSDAQVGVAYTATSNATWLLVSPGTGNTTQPNATNITQLQGTQIQAKLVPQGDSILIWVDVRDTSHIRASTIAALAKGLESEVKNLGDKQLLAFWRALQTSDHFYYMSLKTDSDGSVHAYFSPFESSYEAFISYMNVVTHLSVRINEEKLKPQSVEHDLSSLESERQNIRTSTPVWAMSLSSGLPGAAHGTKD